MSETLGNQIGNPTDMVAEQEDALSGSALEIRDSVKGEKEDGEVRELLTKADPGGWVGCQI